MAVKKPTGEFASLFDLKVLAFVFKWKVAPLFALKAQLKRDEKDKTFEKRIERLVRKGLLQRVDHLGQVRLLQLTDAGFLRFRQGIDGFKEEGFASECVGHDFFAMALQFGIFASAKPKSIDIVSEQEMRRFQYKELPTWMPKIDGHRPDGITRFKYSNETRIIAYEVEVSSKEHERYLPVMQYYNSCRDISLVIWLVKNQSLKKIIIESARMVNPNSLIKHAFILLDHFKSSLWEAAVEIDQKPSCPYVGLMSQLARQDISLMSEMCRTTTFSDFKRLVASS